MRTRRATNFTHWYGMNLTPDQALSFEKFKHNNIDLMRWWRDTFPSLRHIPPIYWNPRNRKWYWSDVERDEIPQYMAICKAMMQAKNSGAE